MALCRLDIPGLVLYNGSIAPGRWRGKDVTIQDVFEAVGRHATGEMDDADLLDLEGRACPGAGACGGQFTANTMATALEFMGLSPSGLTGIPATEPGKKAAAEDAGRIAVQLVRDGILPSSIVTRDAIENAIVSVAATGGSTNGVLHLLAIAREIGVDITDRRLRCDRRAHPDRRRPEARRSVRRGRPLQRGRRRIDHEGAEQEGPLTRGRADGRRSHDRADRRRCGSCTSPRSGRADRGAAETDRRARDVAREPRPRGFRREARRSRASVPPRTGARLRLGGCVLRGSQGADDPTERRDRHPVRGACGGAGHEGDARRHRRTGRRGHGRQGRADHRRPVQRRDARIDGRSRRTRSRHGGVRSPRCATATRSNSTCRRASYAFSSTTTR